MSKSTATFALMCMGLLFLSVDQCESDTTIYDIQTGVIPEGEEVVLKGVVVTTPLAKSVSQRFYAQEPGGGAYSGIYVYKNDGSEIPNLSPGDVVDLTGTYIEYTGLSELYIKDASGITVVGRVPAPRPLDVLPEDIWTNGPEAEAFEGVLLRVQEVEITDAAPDSPSDFGEFVVNDTLRVDDLFYEPIGDLDTAQGTRFTSITGVLHHSYDHNKLQPRFREDYTLDPTQEPPPGTEGPFMTATFLDVGQGDAALFQLPDGTTILVDGGKEGEGAEVLLPTLEQKGIEVVDLMILSHPHADHCGGLDDVLDAIPVLEVWENGEGATTASYQSFASARDQSGAELLVVEQGYQRSFGEVDIEVLTANELYPGENNDSIVFRLSFGEIDFLMTGDIEEEEQLDIVLDYGAALEAEVVKVPHHGSANFDGIFPSTTSPDYAIFSLGEGNPFGHPAPNVVTAYENAGAQICRTDLVGTIIASTNGEMLEVSCSTSEQ